jgi:hypothetical protein
VKEWPDFFIVGAAKSGTTSIYHYLKEHPSIFMPVLKEPRFFTYYGENSLDICQRLKAKVVTDENEYISLFKDAENSQIKGEASPIYLFLYQKTIENMSKLVPDYSEKKIIIILRNPVARAFSHYRMYLVGRADKDLFSHVVKNKKRDNLTALNPFYDYISPGFYYSQVKAYMNSFNNVFICLYEDLKHNPQELMKNLYTFLNVDSEFTPNYQIIYNQGGVKEMYKGVKGNLRRVKYYIQAKLDGRNLYPYPYKNEDEMYQDYFTIYPQVHALFEKDINELQNLIGRDLSIWKQAPLKQKAT